jgi:hypothetical protein
MSEQKQKEQPLFNFLKYSNLIDAIHGSGVDHSVWFRLNKNGDACDKSIQIFIILLCLKLDGVPDFDDHAYDRLFIHIFRKFCGEDDHPFNFSDVQKLTIEELIEKQILEGARYINIKRFIACLDELRFLGHINDCEGRLDTTAFAQFVNSYFFLNKENFNRFIVNLYPDNVVPYQLYLKSLKK